MGCLYSLSRTDALLLRLSLLVGQQVFYGALWGSMLVTPMVRLPASVFIVTHFDCKASPRQQTHMLGYDHRLVVSVCVCLTALSQDEAHLIMMWFFVIVPVLFQINFAIFPKTPSFLLSKPRELLDFCVSSDEVGVSFSGRFECPGAEEHA